MRRDYEICLQTTQRVNRRRAGGGHAKGEARQGPVAGTEGGSQIDRRLVKSRVAVICPVGSTGRQIDPVHSLQGEPGIGEPIHRIVIGEQGGPIAKIKADSGGTACAG